MKILNKYLVNNPCYKNNVNKVDNRYRDFQKNGAKGLMLHSVGCPQPNASVFYGNWNNESYSNACVHAFIDSNTGDVWQTLPWNYRGWHGGGKSNDTHIGVEMCESGYIKYINGWQFTFTDKAKAQADCKRTYNAAVELFAKLCKELHLDPLKDIVSHAEGYRKGIATNHGDPESYWNQMGLGYTMDGFRADVKAKMKKKEETPNMTEKELTKLIDKRIEESFGKFIKTINDVPWESLKPEIRQLLDCEAINGGTDKEKNADDINLPLNVLRAVVMATRYTNMKIEENKQ